MFDDDDNGLNPYGCKEAHWTIQHDEWVEREEKRRANEQEYRLNLDPFRE